MAEAYEMIAYGCDAGIATITLDRPDRLNAAPPQMFDEIRAALGHLPNDGARALLITGRGRAFCSGADLAARGDRPVTSGEGSRTALETSYNPTLLALAALDIPVISSVNGPAAGIGCSLALAADFTIAGESAYFLQAFVNIGLIPDGGATWTLTRAIGVPRALQMMMLGERISASQAADWGLIYQAVPDETLADEAHTLARRLADGPTLAIGLMRNLARAAMSSSYAEAMGQEAMGQAKAGSSTDAIEGVAAFMQKRKPAFQGH